MDPLADELSLTFLHLPETDNFIWTLVLLLVPVSQ
jgi:hypothetical protein